MAVAAEQMVAATARGVETKYESSGDRRYEAAVEDVYDTIAERRSAARSTASIFSWYGPPTTGRS